MTWFIERAISIAPMPVLVFEATDHRFVADNRPARDALQKMTGRPDEVVDREELFERVGLLREFDYVKRSPSGRWHASAPFGWFTMSLMKSERWHARPDLIVVTAHASGTEHEADMDHWRVMSMLLMNEAVDKTVHAIETAGSVLTSAAHGLEALRDYQNRSVGDLMQNDFKEISEKALTELRGLAEG